MENKHPIPRRHRPYGLDILYEDHDILVIEKIAGLLTNSPHRDQSRTAERILTNYVRKGNQRSRLQVFTVHRLDRDTSGLLLFAKSETVQQQLKNDWPSTEKRYFAVIHGHLKEKQGTLSGWLTENSDQFVHTTTDPTIGEWAETDYTILKETPRYSALSATLRTGRKNQIRVQFSEAGHPVVGDPKYGLKGDGVKRMALHAAHLEFNHPTTGRRMPFDSPVPEFLRQLLGDYSF